MAKKIIKFYLKFSSDDRCCFQILEQREATRRIGGSLIRIEDGTFSADNSFYIRSGDFPAIYHLDGYGTTDVYLRGRNTFKDSDTHWNRSITGGHKRFRNNFLTAMSAWADFVRGERVATDEEILVNPQEFPESPDHIYEF